MPCWDIAELEPGIGSVVGLSRGLGCTVDLKLGGSAMAVLSPSLGGSLMAAVSPSLGGSSKRLRAASGGGGQVASCLVDGCQADLSKCREYHRRHKVCEAHSKTPAVSVAGQQQRFCQQCSRFHILVEFDEVKRSCRKRLEGHNRRRRKPPSGPVNSGSIFMTFQGANFSSYSQLFPSAMSDPKWTGTLKTANGSLHTRCSPLHLTDRQNQFSFQHEDRPVLGVPAFESNWSERFAPAGLNRAPSTDSALSLLSPPKNSDINFGQMMPPTGDPAPVGRPLFSDMQQGSLVWFSGLPAADMVPAGENFSCILAADSDDAGVQYQGFYHTGGEGSSNGACPSSIFSMAATGPSMIR